MESTKQHLPEVSDLEWRWSGLEHMASLLLYDMLALREAIFVVEQTCVYQELDGLDKMAQHLLATQGGSVVACLRLLPPIGQETRVRIGRVAVSPGWRGRQVARLMMRKAIEKAHIDYPSCDLFLNSQTYLQPFYLSLGFEVCGGEFLEDGIPHIPMQKLNDQNNEKGDLGLLPEA